MNGYWSSETALRFVQRDEKKLDGGTLRVVVRDDDRRGQWGSSDVKLLCPGKAPSREPVFMKILQLSYSASNSR